MRSINHYTSTIRLFARCSEQLQRTSATKESNFRDVVNYILVIRLFLLAVASKLSRASGSKESNIEDVVYYTLVLRFLNLCILRFIPDVSH